MRLRLELAGATKQKNVGKSLAKIVAKKGGARQGLDRLHDNGGWKGS